MDVQLLETLVKKYHSLGLPFARAIAESEPVDGGILDDFERRVCPLPVELRQLYLWKNGVSDSWIRKGADMLPGFFFEPFERSARELFRKRGEGSLRFEFLVDFGGGVYYVPIGDGYCGSSPVFSFSPVLSHDFRHYDSVEKMILTLIQLFDCSVFVNEDGDMEWDDEKDRLTDKISSKLNPQSEYWKRRVMGIYD